MNSNNKLELRKINIFKCKRPENQGFEILVQLYTTDLHNKTFWAEISNDTVDCIKQKQTKTLIILCLSFLTFFVMYYEQ